MHNPDRANWVDSVPSRQIRKRADLTCRALLEPVGEIGTGLRKFEMRIVALHGADRGRDRAAEPIESDRGALADA